MRFGFLGHSLSGGVGCRVLPQVLSSTVHGAYLQECDRHLVIESRRCWTDLRVQQVTQRDVFQAWYESGRSGNTGHRQVAAQPRVPAVVVDGEWGTNPTCEPE